MLGFGMYKTGLVSRSVASAFRTVFQSNDYFTSENAALVRLRSSGHSQPTLGCLAHALVENWSEQFRSLPQENSSIVPSTCGFVALTSAAHDIVAWGFDFYCYSLAFGTGYRHILLEPRRGRPSTTCDTSDTCSLQNVACHVGFSSHTRGSLRQFGQSGLRQRGGGRLIVHEQ